MRAAQLYGKYLVRLRMDPGPGNPPAILLRAYDGSWMPEVAFSENNGRLPQVEMAMLHYGQNSVKYSRLPLDLTVWHTVGLEWTPGKLVFTLDGLSWATITGVGVPKVAIAMATQTEAWPCDSWAKCPNASTPSPFNLYVDWVAVYRYAPVPAEREGRSLIATD